MWWGPSLGVFADPALSTTVGSSGGDINGGYLNGATGWDIAIDDWQCDGTND